MRQHPSQQQGQQQQSNNWIREIPIRHITTSTSLNTFPQHSTSNNHTHHGFENGGENTGTWKVYPHRHVSRPALLLTEAAPQPHQHKQHNTLRLTKSHDFGRSHDPHRSHDTSGSYDLYTSDDLLNRHRLQRTGSISSQASSVNQGKTHQGKTHHRQYTLKPISGRQNLPVTQQSLTVFPVAEPVTPDRKQLRYREPSPQPEPAQRPQTLKVRQSSPVRTIVKHQQSGFVPQITSTPHRSQKQMSQVTTHPHGDTYLQSTSHPSNRQSNAKPNADMVQEWFTWQDNSPAYKHQGQPQVRSDGVTCEVVQYPGTKGFSESAKMLSPVDVKYPNNQRTRSVPFTKHTGSTGQQQFITLMQPMRTRSKKNINGKPPKGPSSTEQDTRRPKTYHFEGPDNYHNNVVYTEVQPQEASKQGSVRKDRIKSEPTSPVIYTEVLHYDKPRPAQGDKPSPDNRRISMTFGDDLSVCESEQGSTITLQNLLGSQSTLISPHQGNPSTLSQRYLPTLTRANNPTTNGTGRRNKENNHHHHEYNTRPGHEYTMRPGFQNLELDLNNNLEKYDNVNSFPDEASLDRMMDSTDTSCDTTSTKTIKSALKQPRNKRGGSSKKSKKRVTIKENKERTPPGSVMRGGYENSSHGGLTLQQRNTTNGSRPADHYHQQQQQQRFTQPFLLYPPGLRVVRSNLVQT